MASGNKEYELAVKIGGKIESSFKNAMGKAGDGLKSLAKVAAAATAAAAIALAGMGTAAISAGIEFESAFAGVKKTVEATPEQLETLNQGIRDMAKEMPTTAAEIAGVAEAAGQLGIETDNILGFTETMVMLGDATNMSAEDAATTLAKFANITGMSQENFSNLGSTIVALGNNYATTESDIANMAMNLASAGTQVGMSESDILALSAALSSVGLESQAGGTAFSKALINMQLAVETNSESLQDWANVAGMSTDQFATMFKEDATGALQAFIQGLSECGGETDSAIKVLDEMGITETRMRDALLRSAGASDVFTSAIEMGSQAWDENTALANEASQRYATMESRIAILKNGVTDLGISLYEDLKEPMGEIVQLGTDMVDSLSEAYKSGGLEGMVGAVGDCLATVVDVIASYAPKVVQMAMNLISSFVKGIAQNKDQIATAAAETLTEFINGIINLIPQLIFLAVDLITSFANSIIGQLPSIISAGSKALSGLITGILQRLPEITTTANNLITTLATGLIQNLPQVILSGSSLMSGLVDSFADTLPTILSTGVTLIQTLIDGLISMLPNIIQSAITLITTLIQGLVSMLPGIIQAGFSLIFGLLEGIMANLPLILEAAISLVFTLVEGIVSMLPYIIQSGIELVINFITSIIDNLPSIIEAAVEIVFALIAGLIAAIPELIAAIPKLLVAIIDTIMNTDWIQVGIDIIGAIGNGILDGAKNLGGSIIDGVLGLLGLGGGNEEAEEAGVDTSKSYADGVSSASNYVNSASSYVADSAANGLDATNQAATQGYNAASSYTSSLYTGGASAYEIACGTAGSYTSGLGTALYSDTDSPYSAGVLSNDAYYAGLRESAGAVIEGGGETQTEFVRGLEAFTPEVANAGIGTVGEFTSSIEGCTGTVEAAAGQTANAYIDTTIMALQGAATDMENVMSTAWNNIASNTSQMWTRIHNITIAIAKATANAIKTAFESMTIVIPRPKIPVVDVTYRNVAGGDGGNVTVPNFNVRWNAVGAIFDSPTIFGTQNGFQGVGEAGAEAVLPLDTLWTKMRSIMSDLLSGQGDSVGSHVNDLLDRISSKISSGSSPELATTGAPPVQWSPTYNFYGGTPTKEDMYEAEKTSQSDFNKMMEKWQRDNRRKKF